MRPEGVDLQKQRAGVGGHILIPKWPVEMHYTWTDRWKEPSSIQKRKPETMVPVSWVTRLLYHVGACMHLHIRLCEHIYREGCAYGLSVAFVLIRVSSGWLMCFLVCLHVCFCWVLASASPEIGVWRIRQHHSDARREGTEKTNTKHPPTCIHTLEECPLQTWDGGGVAYRCSRHTHAPLPLLPIQRGCQNTQRFLWGGTPTLQHGASQLTTHTQIHLSLSVSPNLLLNGGLCILELMFSPSVYLSLFFSLSFSRSAISMSPCSLGLVTLSFPLCSIRWLLWITAVALLCPLSLNLLSFWTILSNKLDLWLCVIPFKACFCPVLSSSSMIESFL